MSINWNRFCEIINSHQTFLLSSHVRPDCDALGSELGMAGILTSLGKQVTIVNGDAVPPNLAFIDPEQCILQLGEDIQPADLVDFEVMMVLDTSSWAQLGPMGDILRSAGGIKMVLDHHVGEDDLGAKLFKNTTAEATGRLVVEAGGELGVPLTAKIAVPLFAAQATDTGWYRFQSTTGDALRIAAQLVDAGAVPQDLYASLYEQETLGRLRLRGIILAKTTTELDGLLAYTYVEQRDFDQAGALQSDTEDVNKRPVVLKSAFAVAAKLTAVVWWPILVAADTKRQRAPLSKGPYTKPRTKSSMKSAKLFFLTAHSHHAMICPTELAAFSTTVPIFALLISYTATVLHHCRRYVVLAFNRYGHHTHKSTPN